MPKKIIPYNPKLKELAKQLRNNSTKSEIILWKHLRNKQMMGYDFDRQKPIDNYIVDFFCRELMLGIELDGYSHSLEHTVDNDILKTEKLNQLGIKIIRFQDGDIFNEIARVLYVIENTVLEMEINNSL